MQDLPQDFLRALFDYKDGNLYWKFSVGGSTVKGGKAGTDADYNVIRLFGTQYFTHRLIWIWHYGDIPEEIDHINRKRLDNRIENLRLATHSQNGMNRSNVKGMYWDKDRECWLVRIRKNKKTYFIGRTKDMKKAIEMRKNAEDKYHGEFGGR
jgi:hypothetical protein